MQVLDRVHGIDNGLFRVDCATGNVTFRFAGHRVSSSTIKQIVCGIHFFDREGQHRVQMWLRNGEILTEIHGTEGLANSRFKGICGVLEAAAK